MFECDPFFKEFFNEVIKFLELRGILMETREIFKGVSGKSIITSHLSASIRLVAGFDLLEGDMNIQATIKFNPQNPVEAEVARRIGRKASRYIMRDEIEKNNSEEIAKNLAKDLDEAIIQYNEICRKLKPEGDRIVAMIQEIIDKALV